MRHLSWELDGVRRCSTEWLGGDTFERVNSPHTTWTLNWTDALISCYGLDPQLIHISAGPTTCPVSAGPTSSPLPVCQLSGPTTSPVPDRPPPPIASPFPILPLLRQPSPDVHLLRHALKMASVKEICPRGNNKVVIYISLYHHKCLLFILELY